ncbi:tetratricopeptide repeat protein [Salegentibacter chungangensis]|uniref:Tetratricopeptide repeat protein n=1 Tax=Salegentibacter chungangensis TaxID=1335724 RepID=A0ABW3NQT1_9FLAO
MRSKAFITEVIFTGIFCLLFFLPATLSAQEAVDKKEREQAIQYLREAEDALAENDFASAEAAYRKAIAKDPSNTVARYNMGNLYYNKEKAAAAGERLKQAGKISDDKEEKHRIFHNLGNSYMKQKNYQAAVEAYKNALRNVPSDEETRYNLALAKEMLKKQQQQNQDKNKDDKGGKDNQDKKDQNKDKKNQDGEGGEDEKKEGEPKDEGEDKKDKDKENKGDNEDKKDQGDKDKQKQGEGDKDKKKPQPQPAQGKLSPQQIKNLLEAMNNEEKKVQDKINAKKTKGAPVRSEKDW